MPLDKPAIVKLLTAARATLWTAQGMVATPATPGEQAIKDLIQSSRRAIADVVSLVEVEAVPAPAPLHARCGWIHTERGYAEFLAAPGFYHAIHPVLHAIATDGLAPLRTLAGAAKLPALRQACLASGCQLWPTVAAVEPGDPSRLRAMMSDAGKRAAHIAALVALAGANDYAGLDLDYEHLREPTDKALFTAFAAEAATALHAKGKQLSLCLSALSRPVASNNADYPALAAGPVDALHLMGYGYHENGLPHDGPLAPVGWIDLVCAHAAKSGKPAKFVLGLGNYGSRGIAPLADRIKQAGAGYATTPSHMPTCSLNEDKVAGGREPRAKMGDGLVYFDDLESLAEKVATAQRHGLGGICVWTVGGEPAGYHEMVKRYFK